MVEQFAPEGWSQLKECLNARAVIAAGTEHIHLSSCPVPSNDLLPHFCCQSEVLHGPCRSASKICGWVLHTGGIIALSPGVLALLSAIMLDEGCLGNDRFVLSMMSISYPNCCSHELTDLNLSPVSPLLGDDPVKELNRAEWFAVNLLRSKSEQVIRLNCR